MASKMRRAVPASPVELRRLRAQQMRERLVGQRLARLAGVAGGQRAVAGADGDHAAREASSPRCCRRRLQQAADRAGARPHPAQSRPHQHSDAHQQQQHDEGTENAGLGHVALPLDDDRAGPVGQPVQAGGNGAVPQGER